MIFDANEMNHLMGDINKQMNDKIDLIEDLKRAIMKLANETKIDGEAYSSNQKYLKSTWVMILQSMQRLCKAVIKGNKAYMNDFYAHVDGSCGAYIDTDYLEECDKQIEYYKQYLYYQATFTKFINLDYYIDELETKQRKIRKVIEDLLAFDKRGGNYYSEAENYYNQARRGIQQLIKSDIGIFSPSKVMSFVKDFMNVLKGYDLEYTYSQGGVGKYGADQGSPNSTFEDDKYIVDIIQKYYPDLKEKKDIEAFLLKMYYEGCSYAALTNTIFVEYAGREDEFYEIFGFEMYQIINGTKVYNYNYLMVDLYCQMDSDFVIPIIDKEITGTFAWDRDKIITEYLESKGVEVEYETGNLGVQLPDILGTGMQYLSDYRVSESNYEKLSKEGQVLLVTQGGFNIYSVNPEVRNEKIGGWHVMTVIGIDETSGFYIVSSWGNQYLVDPKDLTNTMTSMPSTFEVIKFDNK